MKFLNGTPYKIVFIFLFVCNLPAMASRSGAHHPDLLIIYLSTAGILLLIVEYKKIVEKVKYFIHKLIGIVKK